MIGIQIPSKCRYDSINIKATFSQSGDLQHYFLVLYNCNHKDKYV